MFDNDKRISNRDMLIMGSLFVAAPAIGALFKNLDLEKKTQNRR